MLPNVQIRKLKLREIGCGREDTYLDKCNLRQKVMAARRGGDIRNIEEGTAVKLDFDNMVEL